MSKYLFVFLVLVLSLTACQGILNSNNGNGGLAIPNASSQWAVSAKASSAYGGVYGEARDDQSPFAATGEPDVLKCEDDIRAWVPENEDEGEQWLELSYASEVYLSKVRIKESLGPGAVTKVEVLDADKYVKIWEGKDTNKNCPGFFEVEFRQAQNNITKNMMPFKTTKLKITLDTDAPGWNEIDAVELIGYDQKWYVFNETLVVE